MSRSRATEPTLLVPHTSPDAIVELPEGGICYNDGRPVEEATPVADAQLTLNITEADPVEATTKEGE